jgi:hypothetical protein
MNYIESTAVSNALNNADKLNLQGLFVDRQYDLLLEHQGLAL